eukprot:scaffold6655_cov169-Amphora_coffeaeformis.AAC.37
MTFTFAFRSTLRRHHPTATRFLLVRPPPQCVPSASRRGLVGSLARGTTLSRTRYCAISTTTSLQLARKEPFSVLRDQKVEKPYHLVIVESPSKCATIEKILKDFAQAQGLTYSFVVTSCLGHIRNLPSKEPKGKKSTTQESRFPYTIAGIDLDHKYEPNYIIIPGKEKVVRDLKTLAKDAEKVLLATDPDREGEAMAWHLQQVLGESLAYERISFTEITPSAVQRAISTPVSINPGLVQAQETRRILDRLAGFTVSPLLWKKIAPGLSAGRVQSVGMALVVQRERERLAFEPTEYCSIEASFDQGNLNAQLRAIGDTPVALSGKDFASQGRTLSEASAHKLHLRPDNTAQYVTLFENERCEWKVMEVKASKREKQPPQPYRTSTLQQDANRRLGLGVDQCMRTAQQLYENGLISYMRTDATYISEDAEASLQQAVVGSYGLDMYESRKSSASSKHKKDSKFAQEAHEAIRPAIQSNGEFLNPDSLTLPQVAKELYQMIYRRTLASRMTNLVTNLTQVTIEATIDETTGVFKTSGSVVVSPGWSVAYGALSEDDDDAEKRELPPLVEGQILHNTRVEEIAHETQPPPRYTEASFVKELEALGVGRPSTYAGIVKILRERAYVGSPSTRQNNRQTKEIAGPAISAHRAAGGSEFTGSSKGSLVPSLPAFAVCSLLENHCPSYVDSHFTSEMEQRLDQIANSEDSSEDERLCYLQEFYEGDSGLAWIVKGIEDTVVGEELRCVELPALKGDDETTGHYREIRLLVGPWGPYIQGIDKQGVTVKAPLSSSMAADLSTITREMLETHVDGTAVIAAIGPYGPYLKCNNTYANLNGDDDILTIDSTKAESLIREALASGGKKKPRGTLAELGEMEGSMLRVKSGRFGNYISWKKTNAKLPEGYTEDNMISLEEAWDIVCEKKGGSSSPQKGRPKEASAADLPPPPKRPPSSYLLFCSENREKIKEQKLSLGDSSKLLSEMWSKVSKEERSRFDEEAALRKQEYDREKAEWKDECEQLSSKEKTSKRKAKLTNGATATTTPKRPKSAYLFFCSEKRPEVSAQVTSLGAISKELARLWKETADRTKYEKLAAEDKARYEREKVNGESPPASNGSAPPKKMISESAPKRAPSKKSSPKSAPKRAPSAYMLFCKEFRESIVDEDGNRLPLGETTKRLAAKWQSCDNETRKKFERMALDEKEKVALMQA